MGKQEDSLSSASSDEVYAGAQEWCNLEVKTYVKVDSTHLEPETNRKRTPVMVSVTALDRNDGRRRPIDVVLVLHVSSVKHTTPKNWHTLLNKASKLVVDNLGHNDRLAVVPALSKTKRSFLVWDDDLKVKKVTSKREETFSVKPMLMLMTSENKTAVIQSVESSDAMKNNTDLSRQLEMAESILCGRESEEKEKRAGHMIVISNSSEDLSPLLIWRFPSVHAFGFWEAHNVRAMHTIARSRESTFGILDEGDNITQAFAACISRLTSAVVPVEIKLKCNKQEVHLSAIYAPRVCYSITNNKKAGTIWANVQCGSAATNFILHLNTPADYGEHEFGSLLTVHVMYGHPPDSLRPAGRSPLVPIRMDMAGSKEMVAELARIEAVEILSGMTASDKNEYEELHEAADALRERWSEIKESVAGRKDAGEEPIAGLDAEIQEIETRLHNNYWWFDRMLPRSHPCWPLPPLIMNKQQTTNERHLLQLQIMAKANIPYSFRHEGRLPVLIQIKVPVEGLAMEKRAPIDLVTVLGVGCQEKETMNKRLNMLNKAMEFVMWNLSHKDRLAIIPTQSDLAKHPAHLSPMTKEGRIKKAKMLSQLYSQWKKAPQTWQWKEQLKKVTCLPITSVNTTGAAGSTNLSKSLMDAIKLLEGRADKNRVGLIIILSDNNVISTTGIRLNSEYAIHTFSFHGANNAEAMSSIAGNSRGIYDFIDDDIGGSKMTAFKNCIRKITSIIAVNIMVNIDCNPSNCLKLFDIKPENFTFNINDNKKYGSIFLGDLYGGAERRFITYLDNVPYIQRMSEMFALNVTWQHASSREDARLDLEAEIVYEKDKRSKEMLWHDGAMWR